MNITPNCKECVPAFLPYLSGMQSARAVLYCHLWHTWFYNIFCYHLINETIFDKKIAECEKCF